MPRDIEAILRAHGIEMRQGGKFELLAHCPLCASSDPSQHLSISTRGRGWRCLRNPKHRGKSYARLLVVMCRMDMDRARELLGERRSSISIPTEEAYSNSWRKQLGLETEPKIYELKFPETIKPLKPCRLTHKASPLREAFWNYLYDRGFTEEQALWAAKTYNLHYAVQDRFNYRIVIPVYTPDGRLATWTGRSIHPDARIRYLTQPTDLSLLPPTDLLLGLPILSKAVPARCLVVCEGPFDAIAVSTLGHEEGIWGTCLFGLELSDAQADLLAWLGGYFERTRLLIDDTAWLRILSLKSKLPRHVKPARLLRGVKDPGVLIQRREGKSFVLSLAA